MAVPKRVVGGIVVVNDVAMDAEVIRYVHVDLPIFRYSDS